MIYDLLATRRELAGFFISHQEAVLFGYEESRLDGIDPDVRRVFLSHA
jgi:hypothetical protein